MGPATQASDIAVDVKEASIKTDPKAIFAVCNLIADPFDGMGSGASESLIRTPNMLDGAI